GRHEPRARRSGRHRAGPKAHDLASGGLGAGPRSRLIEIEPHVAPGRFARLPRLPAVTHENPSPPSPISWATPNGDSSKATSTRTDFAPSRTSSFARSWAGWPSWGWGSWVMVACERTLESF